MTSAPEEWWRQYIEKRLQSLENRALEWDRDLKAIQIAQSRERATADIARWAVTVIIAGAAVVTAVLK